MSFTLRGIASAFLLLLDRDEVASKPLIGNRYVCSIETFISSLATADQENRVLVRIEREKDPPGFAFTLDSQFLHILKNGFFYLINSWATWLRTHFSEQHSELEDGILQVFSLTEKPLFKFFMIENVPLGLFGHADLKSNSIDGLCRFSVLQRRNTVKPLRLDAIRVS